MKAVLLVALALAASPALAGEERPAGTVSVIGHAQSETAPDFASIEIGVEAKAATPGDALDGTSAAARKLIALAAEFGVPEGEIGTTAVNLQPVTRMVRQPDGTAVEKPDGYRAANQVRIRLADMGKLGDLMRRALDAGANRIEGISFGLKDPDAAQAALRVAAVKDALTQARLLAEAAGVKLGPVISIQSPPREERAPMAFAAPMRAKARGGAPVPLVAGSIAASAEVAAVFAVVP